MIFSQVVFLVRRYLVVLFLPASLLFATEIRGQTSSCNGNPVQKDEICDSLMFREPAKHFRPQIWYHFISGNITAEGVKADMKAIHEAGFSGIQLSRASGR